MISHAKMAAWGHWSAWRRAYGAETQNSRKGVLLGFRVPPFGRGAREPRTQTSEEGMLVGAGVCEGHSIRLVLSV